MEEPILPKVRVGIRPLSYFAVTFLALAALAFGLASEPFYRVVLASVAKVF